MTDEPKSYSLIPNSFQHPNFYVDRLYYLLTGEEVKVLDYILRRTWGFQKPSDAISIGQMAHGMVSEETGRRLEFGIGISEITIREILVNLKEWGIVGVKSPPGKPKIYTPELDASKIRFDLLEQRWQQKQDANKQRMKAACHKSSRNKTPKTPHVGHDPLCATEPVMSHMTPPLMSDMTPTPHVPHESHEPRETKEKQRGESDTNHEADAFPPDSQNKKEQAYYPAPLNPLEKTANLSKEETVLKSSDLDDDPFHPSEQEVRQTLRQICRKAHGRLNDESEQQLQGVVQTLQTSGATHQDLEQFRLWMTTTNEWWRSHIPHFCQLEQAWGEFWAIRIEKQAAEQKIIKQRLRREAEYAAQVQRTRDWEEAQRQSVKDVKHHPRTIPPEYVPKPKPKAGRAALSEEEVAVKKRLYKEQLVSLGMLDASALESTGISSGGPA